jgi:hypothetical protein
LKPAEKLYSYLMLRANGYTHDEAEAITVEIREKMKADREEETK